MRPVFFLCFVSSVALAANYEVPLTTVDDAQDVLDLEEKGDISSSTADVLLELLENGVDLNTASREQLYDLPGILYTDADAIIQYRKNKGRIEDPSELVAAGAITDEQLLLIAPYISLDEERTRLPISGKVHFISAASNGDFLTKNGPAPPFLLNSKVRLPADLAAGFMVGTTRREPGSPVYDASRDALTVSPFAYKFHLPYFWAQWKPGNRKLIVGTFNVGFAERLTIDTSRRYTPDGIYNTEYIRRPRDLSRVCRQSSAGFFAPCADGESDTYVTPDFQWREPFRGVAGSIDDLELPGGSTMDLAGFLSYQTRPIYQYELYNKAVCDDPRDDKNPACSAPQILVVKDPNDFTQDTRLVYTTLPSVYDELLGGAHVAWHPTPQYRAGLTGYGATNFFHDAPPGILLGTQEYSRVPSGGPFGALGIDGKAVFGDFQLTLEGSRSFDSTVGGGGGWGVVQRSVFSPKRHEVEVSLRFYDDKYLNPYARPVSAPDEFDGQRARNELGARVKYTGKLPYDVVVRAGVDFWVLPFTSSAGQAGTANIYSLFRVDLVGFPYVKPAFWLDMRNRNLANFSHGGCSSETQIIVEGDSTFNCSGDLYRLAARLSVVPPTGRYLTGAVQTAVTWKDDVRYKDSFRNQFMMWGELRSQPLDWLLLRGRVRYLNEDTSAPDYLEKSVQTFIEATFVLPRTVRATLRYDVFAWLDARDTTLTRIPRTEHRLLLDARVSF